MIAHNRTGKTSPLGTSLAQRARTWTKRAFSMVELMAVMAVISVVSGFAVVGVNNGTGPANLDTASRKVAQYMQLARSEAITRHTVVRFMVAREWSAKEDATLRRFSLWAWNPEVEVFTPITPWEELPVGLIFEPELPSYANASDYAAADPSSVRVDYVLDHKFAERASFVAVDGQGEISTRFIEFLPSGNARIPGAGTRRAAFVLTQGFLTPQGDLHYQPRTQTGPANWAQVNLDLLTGNARIYRP